jgi:hypothetical protein
MIINHEHVEEFVIVWYWGFWDSIIKKHYTFAKFLCSMVGWVFIIKEKSRKETFSFLGVFGTILYRV